MRPSVMTACFAALAACSSQAPEYREPTRIDGSVEDDGIFLDDQHREFHCSEHPESRWCASLGSHGDVESATQPWVSAEFHGVDEAGDEACYSLFSTRNDCEFPALKQMQIQFDTSRCLEAAPPGQETPPLIAVNTMIQAFKDGALSWDGVGTGVTVDDGSCASRGGCTVITMTCGVNAGLAAASLDEPFETRVVDLPTSEGGVDQDEARVSRLGHIEFDLFSTWEHILAFCPDSGSASIRTVARQVGRHEMGHVFGFGHFFDSDAVMFPTLDADCTPERAISQEFRDALSIFDSSGGAVTLGDVGLGDLDP